MKQKEALRDLFHVCVGVLLAIITSTAFYFLYIYTENNDLVSENRIDYNTYGGVLGTGSMLPTIKQDDILLYNDDNFGLEVGDVYVYEQETTGIMVVHRLVYRDNETCFFKGDGNPYIDYKANCSMIERKVVGIIEGDYFN